MYHSFTLEASDSRLISIQHPNDEVYSWEVNFKNGKKKSMYILASVMSLEARRESEWFLPQGPVMGHSVRLQ
jgi:uncharacterized membrane protein